MHEAVLRETGKIAIDAIFPNRRREHRFRRPALGSATDALMKKITIEPAPAPAR